MGGSSIDSQQFSINFDMQIIPYEFILDSFLSTGSVVMAFGPNFKCFRPETIFFITNVSRILGWKYCIPKFFLPFAGQATGKYIPISHFQ